MTSFLFFKTYLLVSSFFSLLLDGGWSGIGRAGWAQNNLIDSLFLSPSYLHRSRLTPGFESFLDSLVGRNTINKASQLGVRSQFFKPHIYFHVILSWIWVARSLRLPHVCEFLLWYPVKQPLPQWWFFIVPQALVSLVLSYLIDQLFRFPSYSWVYSDSLFGIVESNSSPGPSQPGLAGSTKPQSDMTWKKRK